MIAFIRGKLSDAGAGTVTIDCGGIGYEVLVPSTMNRLLPQIGEDIFLHTYLQVREDGMSLFGFASRDDLSVFKLLITVNGIGPKGAVGILSNLTADDLRFAILSEDAKTIEKAPGIGKKTAAKMILELKDKFTLPDAFETKLSRTMEMDGKVQVPAAGSFAAKEEAIEALTALGYSAADAMKAVNRAKVREGMTSEEILKLSLK